MSLLFLISPIIVQSQNTLNRSFLHDDFGAFQFYNEIVSILNQAKRQNISKIEFDIHETRLTNDSIPKREFENTKLICTYTSDSSILVLKNYKYGSRCYSWGYKFLIKYNIYILIDAFPVSKEDIAKYECKDAHERYNNFERETFTLKNKDTTILTVTSNFWKVKNGDTLLMNDYSDNMTYFIDSEKKIIQRKCSNCRDFLVSYPSTDTTILTHFLDDGLMLRDIISTSKEIKSDNEFVISENISVSEDDSKPRHESFTKTNYLLNKDGLPIKIEVLESKGDWHKIEGSSMIIEY